MNRSQLLSAMKDLLVIMTALIEGDDSPSPVKKAAAASVRNGEPEPYAADRAKELILKVMKQQSPVGNYRALTGREIAERVRAHKKSPGIETINAAMLDLVDAGILDRYTMRARGGPRAYYWADADIATLRCPVTGKTIATLWDQDTEVVDHKTDTRRRSVKELQSV